MEESWYKKQVPSTKTLEASLKKKSQLFGLVSKVKLFVFGNTVIEKN